MSKSTAKPFRLKFSTLCMVLILSMGISTAHAGIFDTLSHVTPNLRRDLATLIYKKELRKKDSAYVFQQLALLTDLATRLDDKAMICAVYDFKADYFSVNRGENPLSPKFHQQAIDLARKLKLPLEAGYHTYKKAQYYFTFREYIPAYQNFTMAYDIFKEIGFEKVPDISRYLGVMSDFYYSLGDFNTTRSILQEALKYYNKPDMRDKLNMITTIGMIYRSESDYGNALKYFNMAKDLATQYKDNAWIGISTGNIGSVYFLEKDYTKALPYLQTDYQESLKYNEGRNAAIAMLRIVKISLDRRNFTAAEAQLKLAEQLLLKKPEYLVQWVDLYSLKAELYEMNGEQARALSFLRKYESAKDTLEKRNNVIAIERIKLKKEMDKHHADLTRLEAKTKSEVWRRNGLITTLFALMLISVVIYKRQKTTSNKERAKADEELAIARKELQKYTENLQQKNEEIERFISEKANNLLPAEQDFYREEQLEQLMHAHIMTDEHWQDFKKLFNKVHTGFLPRLHRRFPDLTQTDERILTLIRLELKNQVMANMLGITLAGIKKAKGRLRKKLDLAENANLEEIVVEI